MNGVDLALGLLSLAALAVFVRWCGGRLPQPRHTTGLAEMGRAVDAARVAHSELDGQRPTRVSKARARALRTDEHDT